MTSYAYRISRRVLAALGVFLLVALHADAQTVTRRLAWDQPAPTTLVDVAGWTYTLAVDASAPVLVTPTCTMAGFVTCTAPLLPLVPGVHTLTLTATSAAGAASSAPLTLTPPGAPVNLKVTVSVTIP